MQAELTPLDGQKAIGITFTDKPVTAFGGLAFFTEHRALLVSSGGEDEGRSGAGWSERETGRLKEGAQS